MNHPIPSLSGVHERIRTYAETGQWDEAETLCNQLFELLPDSLLRGTAAYWISLLRLQNRHNEACCVLHRFLQRLPWGKAVDGCQPAPVLLVHGLDSLRRCNVQFLSKPWDALDFLITSGHFDCHALLGAASFGIDHLYVGPQTDPQHLAEIRDRLGNYQVIVNSIADPACESPSLDVVGSLLAGRRNVINPPQLVLQAERDLLADCLREVPGVHMPRVLRYEQVDEETRASLHAWLEHSRSGLILRPIESQTGHGMERVVDPVMLDAWLDLRPDSGLFACNYQDFRRAGLFHKYRVFVIDGQLLPEHLICARHWNLHSEDRYSLMDSTPALRETEQRFLLDPLCTLGEQAIDSLLMIAERTQLDYVGIDFTQLADGSLLVFEANPAMRLNYDHCASFPYLRPHLDAVSETFCSMIQGMLQ